MGGFWWFFIGFSLKDDQYSGSPTMTFFIEGAGWNT